MMNRDQISNLRKLFIENHGNPAAGRQADDAISSNEKIPGQIRDLHRKISGPGHPVAAARNVAKSIAITSGKGGVGKTNFVANLAIAMSRLGRKVLVLDADLGLANVDVVYGIRPKYNLYHVITGQKKLDEIIVTGPEGVLLVPGGSGIVELANINESERRHFLEELAGLESRVDVILVDTSAGINRNVLGVIRACSDIIFITIPEPPAMADAYGIIKAVATGDRSDEHSMSLIVNRVSGPEEARDVYTRLATVSRRFLNVTIDDGGYILEDRAVSLSVKSQRPFIFEGEASTAAQCVEAIARRLTDSGPGQEKRGALLRIKAGVRSFFSRLGELFN